MNVLAIGLVLTCLAPGEAPALKGLDPVRLCAGEQRGGRSDLEATWGRFTYRFADEASREAFLSDPERFAIQWGGGCARMGPLSGVGDPDRWAVHRRRIFIFASDGCRDGFLAAPERYVVPRAVHPPLTPEALEAGAAWLTRAVEAHAGSGVLDAPEALRLSFEREESGWTNHLEHVITRAGELRRSSSWIPPEPDADPLKTTWVLAEDSFVEDAQGAFPVTSPDQHEDLRRHVHREPLALLRARASRGFLALHQGAGELDGSTVENVLVIFGGVSSVLHLDPRSGAVLGMSWSGRANGGVTRQVVEVFTDWSVLAGMRLASGRRVTVDGEATPSLDLPWGSLEALAELPDAALRPSGR